MIEPSRLFSHFPVCLMSISIPVYSFYDILYNAQWVLYNSLSVQIYPVCIIAVSILYVGLSVYLVVCLLSIDLDLSVIWVCFFWSVCYISGWVSLDKSFFNLGIWLFICGSGLVSIDFLYILMCVYWSICQHIWVSMAICQCIWVDYFFVCFFILVCVSWSVCLFILLAVRVFYL